MADPDTNRAVEDPATFIDLAISDVIRSDLILGFFGNARFANLQSTRGEVKKTAMVDQIRLAAAAEFQRITADVRKRAMLEAAVPRANGDDSRRNSDGSLGESADFRLRRW